MKNSSYICGVFGRDVLALLGVGIFIFTYIGYRSYGSPIPDGFCTARSEIVPSKTGDSATLFSCPYYNFSFMEGTMKNCNAAQGASIATSDPTKAGNIHQFPDLINALIEACRLLPSKMELQVQFIVNNTVITGDHNTNVSGDHNSNLANIYDHE